MKSVISKIKEKLETNFESGGYKLSDTHFENGKNLHSKQYYFAKKYFQNTVDCDDISVLLNNKLNELQLDDNTTLIGFRNYTGLLLTKTIELSGKYNYAIIEQAGDNFVWQHFPHLRKKLIIILPVTCTCSTYIKLRKFIQLYIRNHIKNEQVEVDVNFINIFLILEQSLQNSESATIEIKKLKDSDDKEEKKIFNIYSAFNWTEITPTQILFNNKSAKTYYANPLIRLYSEMYLPESCPICFQDSNNSLVEKPLFPTHDNYETPNLIFGFPNFSPSENREEFYSVFGSNDGSWNTHLYGHTTVNKSSYLNYIRGNVFYKKNKEKILPFFNTELSTHLTAIDKNILFITAENKHNSNFLEDITLTDSLKNKSVTILRFEPSNEFVDNFISLHGKSITELNTKIIYFEDVISAGKTFKLISNYIKHARKESTRKLGRHGFDLVITLVDRTPLFTRDEILKKIYSDKNNNEIENARRFVAFYKLNVPIISATHMGNPLRRRIHDLQKMIGQCHLDSLKSTIGRELSNQRARNLPELDLMGQENDYLHYFPFDNIEETYDESIYGLYKPYLNKERLDLLKLFLSHEINCELAKKEYNKIDYFDRYRHEPYQFIFELIETINDNIKNTVHNFFVLPKDKNSPHRKYKIEGEIIHDTIIKILSRHPFTYYKNIYEAVFCYCCLKLDDLHKKIETSGVKSFIVFRQLKFYIRRSVELNSNFIISERFIRCIKIQYNHESLVKIRQYYYDRQHILRELHGTGKVGNELFKAAKNNILYKLNQSDSYFNYLLFCYKELVFKNPYRSIKLEELVNSKTLLPKEINTPKKYLYETKNLITNPYFQFSGMLKAENVFLLNELKELHKLNIINQLKKEEDSKKQTDFTQPISIYNYYFRKKKNDPIILNALKLIRNSRYNNGNEVIEFRDIKYAVCNMLRAVAILELRKKRKDLNHHKANLNTELKDILKLVIEIINPNHQDFNKSNVLSIETEKKISLIELECAFFVEYRRKSKLDLNSENLYSITSSSDPNNNQAIVLNQKGLVYNLLYGLFDNTDCKNEQTLISAYKQENKNYISFQERYYSKNENSVKELHFEELLKNDLYDESTGEGIKFLSDSKMLLAFRLSKFILPDKTNTHFGADGQAVLLISTSTPANTDNFVKFMSNEKVRLLLLIKEELLEYLQKQFDNDAFIDVLQRQSAISYQSSIRHGISEYTDHLEYLIEDIRQECSTSEEKVELFNIIVKAIKGQLQDIENTNQINNRTTYSKEELLRTMKLLFESTRVAAYSIPFHSVDTALINFESLSMNRLVKEVIIPELIRNMKKYCPRYGDRGLSISYVYSEKSFYFKNKKAKFAYFTSTKKGGGGLGMIKNILQKSFIGSLEAKNDIEEFTLKLTLNI